MAPISSVLLVIEPFMFGGGPTHSPHKQFPHSVGSSIMSVRCYYPLPDIFATTLLLASTQPFSLHSLRAPFRPKSTAHTLIYKSYPHIQIIFPTSFSNPLFLHNTPNVCCPPTPHFCTVPSALIPVAMIVGAAYTFQFPLPHSRSH